MREVKVITDIESSLKDIEKVWRACNWGWSPKEDVMISLFQQRWRNFLLYEDSVPVAYAGVISDHHVYALVVDMMVKPECQKKGMGSDLMEKVISECKESQLKVIKLISSKEGKKLYVSKGFDICSVDAPGMMMRI